MMKYEWRKQDKEIYLPKQKPTIYNNPKSHISKYKVKDIRIAIYSG